MPHWKLFLTQLGELLTDHPDSETVQDSAMNQRKEEIDINFERGLKKYFFKFWPKIDYLRVSFPCWPSIQLPQQASDNYSYQGLR